MCSSGYTNPDIPCTASKFMTGLEGEGVGEQFSGV